MVAGALSALTTRRPFSAGAEVHSGYSELENLGDAEFRGLESIILEGDPLRGVGFLHDPRQRRRVHFEEEERMYIFVGADICVPCQGPRILSGLSECEIGEDECKRERVGAVPAGSA